MFVFQSKCRDRTLSKWTREMNDVPNELKCATCVLIPFNRHPLLFLSHHKSYRICSRERLHQHLIVSVCRRSTYDSMNTLLLALNSKFIFADVAIVLLKGSFDLIVFFLVNSELEKCKEKCEKMSMTLEPDIDAPKTKNKCNE